jgi:hypothetical protein
MAKRKLSRIEPNPEPDYGGFVAGLAELLEQSRRNAARAVNSVLTATYWEVGRRIVEFEQKGEARAEYGEGLLKRLSVDLTAKFGRGYGKSNLFQMRALYLGWRIFQTPSGIFEARAIFSMPGEATTSEKPQTVSAQFPSTPTNPSSPDPSILLGAFPLSWSHYTRLMSVEKPHARAFYESEAIRGGWSVRQLDRQIGTQFFERSSASKQREAMLKAGQKARVEDAISAIDEVRDPYLLEFLDLKDEAVPKCNLARGARRLARSGGTSPRAIRRLAASWRFRLRSFRFFVASRRWRWSRAGPPDTCSRTSATTR